MLKAIQYPPSKGWLVANGHDPRLTRKVHLPQARELFSGSQMLMHPAVILAAYEKAKVAGTNESVLLYTGKKGKPYGLTNHKEYFAEGTEAYLYRNHFYPFARAELKEHDPKLLDVLEKIWGAAN